MENFEQSALNNESNHEMPDELRYALHSMSNNGFDAPLIYFLNKHGEQEPYELDGRQPTYLRSIINFDLELIERELKYDRALHRWNLLKKAGLLTPQSLTKEIERFINSWMALPQENRELSPVGKGEYDEAFRKEFAADLEREVKEGLGWDISIEVK